MTCLILIVVLLLSPSVWGQRIFGNQDESGISETFTTGHRPQAIISGSLTWTASAGDSILWVHMFCASAGGDDSCRIAVYDVVSGGPSSRQVIADMPTTTASSPVAKAWDSVAVNFALSAGTEYCLAIGEAKGSGTITVYVGRSLGSSGDGNLKDLGTLLAASWVAGTDNTEILNIYATLNDEPSDGPTGPVVVRNSPSGAGQRDGPDGPSPRDEP